MPIPFIVLAGAAAAAGLVGAGKGVKAVIDTNDAKSTNLSAQNIVERAKEEAEFSRQNSNVAITHLGEKKLWILNNSITSFIQSFEHLHNIELSDSQGLDEINKIVMDKKGLVELKELATTAADMAVTLAQGAIGGAMGGAVTAFGAYSAAMALGHATTGTAIAALHGAAATNATLAFLGGGALGTGFGVAGGVAVLGGLVAGPALAIMGFVVGAKASANKDEAYSNLAKAKEFEESVKTIQVECKGIRMRANMFECLLISLDSLFLPMVHRLNEIIATRGTDYKIFTQEEKNVVAGCLSLAKTIKTVLDTPILTNDGKVTSESAATFNEVQKIIAQY